MTKEKHFTTKAQAKRFYNAMLNKYESCGLCISYGLDVPTSTYVVTWFYSKRKAC